MNLKKQFSNRLFHKELNSCFLTKDEEQKLSDEEREKYYIELCNKLIKLDAPLQTKLQLDFARAFNTKVFRNILRELSKYKINISGLGNIPSGTKMYLPTHERALDNYNIIHLIPDYSIIVSNDTPSLKYKTALDINASIYAPNKEESINARNFSIWALLHGYNITMFPEGTNIESINRLHTKLYNDPVYIATVVNTYLESENKEKVSVVPVIHNYEYENDKKNNQIIKRIEVIFGKKVVINKETNNKLSDMYSTIKYLLICKSFVRKVIKYLFEQYGMVVGNVELLYFIKDDISSLLENKKIDFNKDMYSYNRLYNAAKALELKYDGKLENSTYYEDIIKSVQTASSLPNIMHYDEETINTVKMCEINDISIVLNMLYLLLMQVESEAKMYEDNIFESSKEVEKQYKKVIADIEKNDINNKKDNYYNTCKNKEKDIGDKEYNTYEKAKEIATNSRMLREFNYANYEYPKEEKMLIKRNKYLKL